MCCAIPRTACRMQSWKRPVDCTTFETRTQSGGPKPNENLNPDKVYYPTAAAAADDLAKKPLPPAVRFDLARVHARCAVNKDAAFAAREIDGAKDLLLG